MGFGKLYSFLGNPRTKSLLAVAELNGLQVQLVHTEPAKGVSPEYLKLNPLGTVPTFVAPDGFVLTECIAIAVYLFCDPRHPLIAFVVASQNDRLPLLGKTVRDYASILRWMSYTNSEVLPSLGQWWRPLVGRNPYNEKSVEIAIAVVSQRIQVLESHLKSNQYLVGGHLTLADVFSASIVSRGYDYVFDARWRVEHPSVQRWYETVSHEPFYKDVVGETTFIEERLPNRDPFESRLGTVPLENSGPMAANTVK